MVSSKEVAERLNHYADNNESYMETVAKDLFLEKIINNVRNFENSVVPLLDNKGIEIYKTKFKK